MKKAFSLIEILIYLGIILLILTSLILMIINFLQSNLNKFFANLLVREANFLSKKINYFLNLSSAFKLTTSTGYFKLEFISSTSLPNFVLNQGRIYLEQDSNLIPLTSQYFNYASSSVMVLGSSLINSYRGIKLSIIAKIQQGLNIKADPSSFETVYYAKND